VSQEGKLSLSAAILINLNIMIGAGIFINTVKLSSWAGALGCFMYPLIGLLLLPLIISIAKLVNLYPEAGFYGYGAQVIHPFVGFMSSWVYFTGKLASVMLMIHVALSLLHQMIPLLYTIPVIVLDVFVLLFFVMLNMVNAKTGSVIQVWFMVLKIIPIFFTIFAGLTLFSWRNYACVNMNFAGIPSALPLVLYAATGFESACSLSCQIKNAQKNGPLAIFISYAIMLAIAFTYQFAFYGALGNSLIGLSHYTEIFPMLLGTLLPGCGAAKLMIQVILYCAIAASALGSAYGILFSNPWNLYSMARYGHTFFKSLFTSLNKHGAPVYCVIAEGLLGLVYLFVSRGDQLSLQQAAALACSITYTLSVLSLVVLVFRKHNTGIRWWIPLLALCNCFILLGACIRNFIYFGVQPLLLFAVLTGFGVIMYLYTSRCNTKGTPAQ
jgi:APA family basic amino acid/polyamine antiporter